MTTEVHADALDVGDHECRSLDTFSRRHPVGDGDLRQIDLGYGTRDLALHLLGDGLARMIVRIRDEFRASLQLRDRLFTKNAGKVTTNRLWERLKDAPDLSFIRSSLDHPNCNG